MHRVVDLETWKRKNTFEFFRNYEDPFFNLTAPLDVTRLLEFCKLNGISFSLALIHYSNTAANEIEEFRTRLVGDEIVIYDRIHSSNTLLNDDETISFAYLESRDSLAEFDRTGKAANAHYASLKSFDVETDRLDLVYYSIIPWVAFTSFKHAVRFDNTQSVPRMVFGKYFEDSGRIRIPHSVEVHHALMDGLHVGKYFESLQRLVSQPSL